MIVIGVLHSSSMELRIVKNHGDLIQAHYLALAGVEQTKALLYQDAVDRRGAAKNHTGELYDSPRHFRDIAFGRGQFRIVRHAKQNENQTVIYGVSDEESRLNLNQASAEELGKLYGMTPEFAASIVDYRDGDKTVTPGGAEAEEYSSQRPPRLPRDGPLRTIRELLMVRGVDRNLFSGEDANQNGLLDPEENDGGESEPQDNGDGILDAGWSGSITVESGVRNVAASGKDRINVQEADETSLTSVSGITTEIAKAIIAYRGQNRLESLADLLDVTAPQPQNQAPPPPPPQANTGGGRGGSSTSRNSARQAQATGNSSGAKVISEDLLTEIADDLTTDSEQTRAGAVNINTAEPDVLTCLPGITPELAQAIVSYRQSSGYFANVACLLKVPGMSRQTFKQLAPRVTTRSETFRILSEGTITSTGARKRMQVVVRVGASSIETLSYREDL